MVYSLFDNRVILKVMDFYPIKSSFCFLKKLHLYQKTEGGRHVRHNDVRPKALSATTLIGDGVVNAQGQDLGKIEDVMLDLNSGRVAYAVLSFGGFLGMGDKLFAIPWEAMTVDTNRKVFILNVDQSTLKNAPGFNKNDWPETDAEDWLTGVYEYYGYQPYWK